jgi:hypothetical protein
VYRIGAEEARLAHNQEVKRSKRLFDTANVFAIMSCVWDALSNAMALTVRDGWIEDQDRPVYARDWIPYLQSHVDATPLNVTWQSPTESVQVGDAYKTEIATHIHALASHTGGYWCSAFDPLFLLVCALFPLHIEHHGRCVCHYAHAHPVVTWTFGSDDTHFWLLNVSAYKTMGAESSK